VFFKAMNSNAISYEWTIIGFGFPIHHYGDTMSHYYPFTNNNMWLVALEIQGSTGCQHKLTQQILVRFGVTTVIGIDDPSYQISEVKVFPNPFAQQATLTFDNPKQMEHSLTIITPMGQVVRTIKNITTENVTINKEYLAGGIYFYQLWAENRAVAVGKFIIK
ncbi:MAG: T9SS type A sorting domain-containing protein, partial [Bacteroidetes bacterium]|nr:T9SS type A sorting domain-containing protein [Bacteroidota bacterium]